MCTVNSCDQVTNTSLQCQRDGDSLANTQSRGEELPDGSLPAYGNINYTVVPNYSRRSEYHSSLAPTFSPPGYNSSMSARGQPQSGSLFPVSCYLSLSTWTWLTRYPGRVIFSCASLQPEPFTSSRSVLIHRYNDKTHPFDEQQTASKINA